jgi:hypothetical protein
LKKEIAEGEIELQRQGEQGGAQGIMNKEQGMMSDE